jgi:hypothetical protein
MSSFIRSTHATKRSRSRGQLGSRTRWTFTPPNSPLARSSPLAATPTPRVSTSTATPWRTSASASLRTCRARPPSITGGYSHDRSNTRALTHGTLYRPGRMHDAVRSPATGPWTGERSEIIAPACRHHRSSSWRCWALGRNRSHRWREIDLELTRGGPQGLAGLSRPAPLCPMAYDLAAAAGVVVDASIGRLQSQASWCGTGDDRVEAAAFVVDLDDVPCLDALEPHAGNSSRIGRIAWPCRRASARTVR